MARGLSYVYAACSGAIFEASTQQPEKITSSNQTTWPAYAEISSAAATLISEFGWAQEGASAVLYANPSKNAACVSLGLDGSLVVFRSYTDRGEQSCMADLRNVGGIDSIARVALSII